VAIKGSLKEASLPDVLQLLSMGRKTGCLGLSFHDSFGSIYFDSGRICHAAIVNRPLDTENSVYTLFTWTSGTFNFEPGVEPEEVAAAWLELGPGLVVITRGKQGAMAACRAGKRRC